MLQEIKDKWIEALRNIEGTKRLARDKEICQQTLAEWEQEAREYAERI